MLFNNHTNWVIWEKSSDSLLFGAMLVYLYSNSVISYFNNVSEAEK